jgi:hypothetical protein
MPNHLTSKIVANNPVPEASEPFKNPIRNSNKPPIINPDLF